MLKFHGYSVEFFSNRILKTVSKFKINNANNLLQYKFKKKTIRKIAVYDSSAFPRGLRSLRKRTKTNPKYEQTQNTNPKYEQTQNTKGFCSPCFQGAVYCNLAKLSIEQVKFLKNSRILILFAKTKISL